jgi:tRNA nucleotidyltransferase (CCA-adding enzyme)
LQVAFRDPLEIGDLAVDGEELQRVGVPRGPALGETLKALLDWVLDDPSRNTAPQLLAEVARRRVAP